MSDVIVIEGEALDYLRQALTHEVTRGRIYKVSVAEDGYDESNRRALKVKLNERMWTPPFRSPEEPS